MEQKTYICQYCGKESNKPNLMSLSIHEIRCDKNPNKNNNIKTPSRKGMYKGDGPSDLTKRRKITKLRKEECLEVQKFICVHCDKDCKLEKFRSSFLSLMNHESQCPSNPHRIINRKITEETRRKLKESGKRQIWSIQRKIKAKEYMRKAVLEHPEAYTSSNRGRVKQVEIDGIKLHGKWELSFYQWAKEKELNPQRCLNSFPYEWNGSRSYFPDFYLPSLNIYIEVKGYETERDLVKWSQFPEKLIVIRKKEIEEIKKGTYDLYHHISLSK